MVNILRTKKPVECEMWLKDPKTGMLTKCKNKIDFIWTRSGGFLCAKCTNRMHKRYPNYGKFIDAKKYLSKIK